MQARKLVTTKFVPELDNLETEDVESVMYKVLIEYDLMNEGELQTMSKVDIMRKRKQVKKFFGDWLEHVTPITRSIYRKEIER